MRYLTNIEYTARAKARERKIRQAGSAKNYSDDIRKYAGSPIMSSEDCNKYMFDRINSGKPFFAGRFGATELLNVRTYDFGVLPGSKYSKEQRFNQLCEWSGFFPNNIDLLPTFSNIIKESCAEVDLLAVWFNAFEDYYIKKYMKSDLKITYLLDFEPWSSSDIAWSSALKGKKVLVIHPFEDTIKTQYVKRENIFPNTDILPSFELITLKAVQTLAGTKDERFENWFEALEYMYQTAMSIDFDIAIIGCGAYGFPLGAKIKKAGKQAIHLAGATQLLFGIKGKRWEKNNAFNYVKKRFNDSWVYPNPSDTIQRGNAVENGCYWK